LGTGAVSCWGGNPSGQLGIGTTGNSFTPVQVSGLTGAVAVATGNNHSCAVRVDGGVRCWGANSEGQLGNASTANAFNPSDVLGVTNAIAITAGDSHTCALLADGAVKCWGQNAQSQLGDGTSTRRVTPVAVSGLTNAVAVAAAPFHTCALLADGTVKCWGSNATGQLGDGTTLTRVFAFTVSGLTNAVALAVGNFHTCALLANGSAQCWGSNTFGQLGDGTTTNRLTPSSLFPVQGLTNAVAITAGRNHTCALTANDEARCWGDNDDGELGTGTTSDLFIPGVVAGGGGSITGRAVAAGDAHTCAVRSDSTAACWGAGGTGQLGDGTVTTARLTPAAVRTPGSSPLANVLAVAAGGQHTCALVADGTVRCWGDNGQGQLGDGTTTQRNTPVTVQGLTNAVAVATGSRHSCALLADGTMRCWGEGVGGQLGSGGMLNQSTPVAVSGLTNAVAVAAGNGHTCALLADGTARCWGDNRFYGQLGDGTTEIRLTPVPVLGIGEPLEAVALTASSSSHTCARLVGGELRCWGSNLSGAVGDGTQTDKVTPVPVLNLATALTVTGGSSYTCASLADGQANCWGVNQVGQLGDGTTAPRTVPSPLQFPVKESVTITIGFRTGTTTIALANVRTVSAGFNHACAVTAAGRVLCWGLNSNGQIGDGTTTTRLTATTVPSFAFNIDPDVVLAANGRVATVTALVNCPEGQQVQVRASLTQDGVFGQGVGVGFCTGGLERYEVTVPAHGRAGFVEGPAQGEADAIVRSRGIVTDTQEWTRDVELAIEP
jgi:alpha-tubulin suppressor-like RCC1 family protein